MMSLMWRRSSGTFSKPVPKLSLVVPVYNEEEELPRLIELFMAAPCPIEREWIFVDDHSTDESLGHPQIAGREASFQGH